MSFDPMPNPYKHYPHYNPMNQMDAYNYGPYGMTDGTVKRRGPKKKPVTQERVVKLRQRRARANARERSRMHGLNHALDTLRAHIPMAIINKVPGWCQNVSGLTESALQSALNSSALLGQRLSKIETLRLARNYISLLADILAQPNGNLGKEKLLYRLSIGLSQITSNQIAVLLGLNPLPSNRIFPQTLELQSSFYAEQMNSSQRSSFESSSSSASKTSAETSIGVQQDTSTPSNSMSSSRNYLETSFTNQPTYNPYYSSETSNFLDSAYVSQKDQDNSGLHFHQVESNIQEYPYLGASSLPMNENVSNLPDYENRFSSPFVLQSPRISGLLKNTFSYPNVQLNDQGNLVTQSCYSTIY